MELNKRINNIDDILNCYTDIKIAEMYKGKKGYFSKSMYGFHDLESCVYGELVEVKENTNQPFIHELYTAFDFFIPESAVAPKEELKPSRPLTIEEFNELCDFGEFLTFKRKDDTYTHCVIYGGYTKEKGSDNPKNDFLHLGAETFSMQELFDEYEYLANDTWKPFGK